MWTDPMLVTSQQLSEIINNARARLLSIHEDRAGAKPNPDKWSLKEILGHLIDSAANNHQRIVRMQEVANIGTFRYTQEHWVKAQHYQDEPWENLVELWYGYNMHLAHIIGHVDHASLNNLCDMGYDQPATLRFLIEDYLRHVQHHLDQIFNDSEARERKQWVRGTPI
jgi:hypothetical protein